MEPRTLVDIFKTPIKVSFTTYNTNSFVTGYHVTDRNGHRIATFVEEGQAKTFVRMVNTQSMAGA